MKKHLNSILTLFLICAIVSVALAVCYGITDPIIKQQQAAAASGALLEVMPNGGTFEKVDLSTYDLPASIKEANKASNGGYVFKVFFKGKYPDNIAMIGVSADGQITGTKCITITDDAAYAGKYFPIFDANGHFNGADITTIDGVDTVAGATLSTAGYRAAVKDALAAATILGGGSVDLRDPAQILNDNLNAALGTEGVEFDKHFFIEVIEGVDAIYVAKNGAGHVVVIGETFVGVGADGNVIGEANEVAANAVAAIKATTFTDVDISAFDGVSKRVKSAKITDGGVYVLEVEGAGFGKKGSSDYGASGEYLVIRISIAPDGSILDCYTVYQSESKGFGDVCATEEFYGQFAGKTQENYEDIIIAGSTYTTDGYHAAIKNAYKAVKIFQGGAN